MSYILDALKKSEQQRQENQLPQVDTANLALVDAEQATGVAALNSQQDSEIKKSAGVIVAQVSAVVLLGVSLAYWLLQQSDGEAVSSYSQVKGDNFSVVDKALLNKNIEFSDQQEQVDKETAVENIVSQPVVKAQQQEPVDIVLLPAHISSSVPAIEVSSHIFSSIAEKRSIVVNGQRMIEGSAIAPNVLIKEITAKGMVISVKNHLAIVDRSRGWK